MGVVYPLDAVIRRVDKNDNITLTNGQKLLCFDAKNSKFFDKKPLLSIGKDIRMFVVSSTNTARNEEPVSCKINDFRSGDCITLKIFYEAHCESGEEKKLISSTYDSIHAGACLNEKICGYVEHFHREQKQAGVDVLQNFFELRIELQQRITTCIQNELGLYLDLKIQLEYENGLKPQNIGTDYFPVYVKDYTEELNLKFKAQIDIDEKNKIAAILSYNHTNQFADVIKGIVQKSSRDGVSLHQFYYDLNGAVHQLFFSDINQRLHQYGRVLTGLSLESSKIGSLPDESKLIHHKVSCEINGFNEVIMVNHTLLLKLTDVGRFKAARNVNNLTQWAHEQLDIITRSVLFDKTYAELILDFKPAEIEELIKEKAKNIGYDVKQLIVIPNLEPLKLKDGFSIDYKGPFSTNDSRVEVKLNIVVSGVIPTENLQKIKHLLTPTADIQKEMEGAIVKEVQKLLHKVDPERFFLRFSSTITPGETPVDQELEDAIDAIIKTKFFAENIDVTVKLLVTEQTERIDQLIGNGPYSFEIEVLPKREGGRADKITFEVIYNVEQIDNAQWHVFQSKKFESTAAEIAKIEFVLDKSLVKYLSTVPAEILQYSDIKQIQKIEQHLGHRSAQEIQKQFGLIIKISLDRQDTAAELAEAEKRTAYIEKDKEADIAKMELSKQSRLTELEQLYKKSLELTMGSIEEDDLELINVNNRIKQITSTMSSYSIEDENMNFKQLTNNSPKEDFSFTDCSLSAPSANDPKRLADDSVNIIEAEQ